MTQKSRFVNLVVIAISGIVGGMLSQQLFQGKAQAEVQLSGRGTSIKAQEFILVDRNGYTKARLIASDQGTGGSALHFYDSHGVIRTQIGTYEDGLPLVALMDKNSNAAGLFRLAGRNESPVIVLKHSGRDRMLMGLDLKEPAAEPFLVIYNQKNQPKDIIGHFPEQ